MNKSDYLSWTVSVICFAGSVAFPVYSTVIWVVGVGCLMLVLWSELRKPLNYESLTFNDVGFVFREKASMEVTAKWSEVKEVFYRRTFDYYANHIETEWEFILCDGRCLLVIVEWPQCSPFAKAIIQNLNQVSAQSVKSAMRQRQEGRWSVIS